jgi:hypothetical protein
MLFVCNIIGDDLLPDVPSEPFFDTPNWRRFDPYADAGEGVFVMYGGPEGVTVLVNAESEEDCERRIIRAYSMDVTIDDMQEAVVTKTDFMS